MIVDNTVQNIYTLTLVNDNSTDIDAFPQQMTYAVPTTTILAVVILIHREGQTTNEGTGLRR
jgi:hypothetical protein